MKIKFRNGKINTIQYFYNLVPTERECLNCFKQKYPDKIEEIKKTRKER
jgi:hypothetical protein